MDPTELEATVNALPPKSEAKGHGKQRKRLVDDVSIIQRIRIVKALRADSGVPPRAEV